MVVMTKNIISILEKHFPLYLAEEWDNSGLQIGSFNQNVNNILIALDMDNTTLEKAITEQADMIITHHPFFFKGIKSINVENTQGKIIKELINRNISLYTAHTNLDLADQGLNQALAELLELEEIKPLNKAYIENLYKLVVFVPQTHINKVRKAVSEAGAGHIGNYSDCTFRTAGTGTFLPREGTNPFIGEKDKLEEVNEFKMETILPEKHIRNVLENMNKAHPYEEVAYDLYPLKNEGKIYSPGRKGILANEIKLEEFANMVKNKLNADHIRIIGDFEKVIKKVAVVSGSGASFINMAKSQRVDLLVTSDVKYHEAKNAQEAGLAIIDAGHQYTEDIMVNYLKDLLSKEFLKNMFNVNISTSFSARVFKYL
ncbi:GTP cyclohydrolase [Candidatus Syntrophocurvum alkaliphilum]|uniref:GTP cyclohydrolase 1 type 2 homolog n=1 Tax=Candidatus Syntrophocurvum alkaliphilum TaxID=2293317 RepID=A0A6I6DEQ6_9FIRM|nr:Nif3-like dinuclear metal center hexameric protein [Candidatus Syntrophocurvum alkaliphilum]QGT99008.1 GTP cyclohydrolase [Candidatus Syntrophocurvum alkaliphilum]